MVFGFIKKYFRQPISPPQRVEPLDIKPKFNICVVEFFDNIENENGKKLANILQNFEGLNVVYFSENFDKSFLNLESRNIFDLIDKGQSIMDKTNADVILWGYRGSGHIRINFQTKLKPDMSEHFVSLLDCLYLPTSAFNPKQEFPTALISLIYGAAISAADRPRKEYKIYKKYLLKKTVAELSKINSAKSLGLEYLPYIMNFLGIIYLSLAYESSSDEDFKVVKNLFETALKHQDLLQQKNHLGCIYYHLGQLYDCATRYMAKRPSAFYRGAIENYQAAQKYLSKYTYPYDYGFICYKLALLYLNYWKQTEDIQALRDAVFQLREAEKIYTQVLFPEFWGYIQGDLGHMLHNLGHLTKSSDICGLAIGAYKNQQKIVTERSNPLYWAAIEEKIGEIYYMQGKSYQDTEYLEEALTCFHNALFIYEKAKRADEVKKINISISKSYQILAELRSD